MTMLHEGLVRRTLPEDDDARGRSRLLGVGRNLTLLGVLWLWCGCTVGAEGRFAGPVAAAPPSRPPVPRVEKTGHVLLLNGDKITCEVKSLSRGRLQVKTDSMSTVTIEWDEVLRIESVQIFRITLLSGDVHFGSLALTVPERSVRIVGEAKTLVVPLAEIANFYPLKKSLSGRFDGNVNFGFGYTKASEVTQSSFSGALAYRGATEQVDLDVSSIVTTQDSSTTRNFDSTLSYTRFLEGPRFVYANAGLQRSDELGIDLRSSVGAGLGANVVRNEVSMWSFAGGLVVNREDASDVSPTDNVEARVVTDLSIFDFDSPSTDLTTSLEYFYNLTTFDRYRGEFDIKLRKELVTDFFFELNVFVNYDSRPPSASASNTDAGVVTSLGYSF